jgi:hypothetical protein
MPPKLTNYFHQVKVKGFCEHGRLKKTKVHDGGSGWERQGSGNQ